MFSVRNQLLEWARDGHLPASNWRAAIDSLEEPLTPAPEEWREFLSRVMLAAGTLATAAAVIFFFAFNWQQLHRAGKFAIVEGLLLAACGFAWWKGTRSMAGRAAMFFAALTTGALFALVGQTYQMEVDSWWLFAVWAGALLPWCLGMRTPELWILHVLAANVAIESFQETRGGDAWWSLGYNLAAVLLAEWRSPQTRILPRVVMGVLITRLTFTGVDLADDVGRKSVGIGLLVYALVIAGASFFYRRVRLDRPVLAALCLSAIAVLVVMTFQALRGSDLIAVTFITGLEVILLSSAAAWWVRR